MNALQDFLFSLLIIALGVVVLVGIACWLAMKFDDARDKIGSRD
jgi:thiosulfate reductase cytochrome b subunit